MGIGDLLQLIEDEGKRKWVHQNFMDMVGGGYEGGGADAINNLIDEFEMGGYSDETGTYDVLGRLMESATNPKRGLSYNFTKDFSDYPEIPVPGRYQDDFSSPDDWMKFDVQSLIDSLTKK